MKKFKIIAVFGIFAISFLCHFAFDTFPCIFSSIIFPVNESIWEHMKILFTSTILYGIIDYMLLKKNKIDFNNFSLQLFTSAFSAIIIFLIIFLPIYNLIGENLPVTLVIMFITYAICQYISFKILKLKEYKILNILSIIAIIIMYIIFGYFTYYPIENDFFIDPTNKTYGITKNDVNL